jgi:hypothetical protein
MLGWGNLGELLAIYIDANDIDAKFNQPHGSQGAGAGCALYQGLPNEIALPETTVPIVAGPPLPSGAFAAPRTTRDASAVHLPVFQRKKLYIHYFAAPTFSDRAIVFQGFPELRDRKPAVQIVGPSSVSIRVDGSQTSASYYAVQDPPGSDNFYGTPLTYTWSGDPSQVRIVSAQSSSTGIIFNGDGPPGSSITQTITVRLADTEGSSATASKNVVVHYPAAPPPPPDCKRTSGCETHPF